MPLDVGSVAIAADGSYTGDGLSLALYESLIQLLTTLADLPLPAQVEQQEGIERLSERLAAALAPYIEANFTGSTARKVRVATTASITQSGEQTIDGVAVVVGDRVLDKDSTTKGIFVVALGAWARATDYDSSSEVLPMDLIAVSEGTANGNLVFALTTDAPITIGVTSLTFAQVTGTGSPSGAAGGDLGGTYPNPTVTQARGLRETAGPTTLSMGAVADGEALQRVGSDIVGAVVQYGESTATFTQPAIAGTVSVTVSARTTMWVRPGVYVRHPTGGNYRCTAVTNSTTIVLQNTGDAAYGNVPANAAAAASVTAGALTPGDAVTDWSNSTNVTFSTAGGGSPSVGTGGFSHCFWRRVGDTLEVQGRLSFDTVANGANFGTGAFQIALPNGYSRVSGAKLISTTSAIASRVYFINANNQADDGTGISRGNRGGGLVIIAAGASILGFILDGGTAALLDGTTPVTVQGGDAFNYDYRCPVLAAA